MYKLLFTIAFIAFWVITKVNAQQLFLPVQLSDERLQSTYETAVLAKHNMQFDKSQQLFLELMEKENLSFMVYAQLALINYHMQRFPEFREFAAKAVLLSNPDIPAEQILGELLKSRMEDLHADVSNLAKKLAINYPKVVEAHLINASIHAELDQPSVVLEAAYNASILAPDYAPTYNMLGYAHLYLGQREMAKEKFEKYRKLMPGHPNPYDSLGDFYRETGDKKQAIEMYRKACEIDPAATLSREKAANLEQNVQSTEKE